MTEDEARKYMEASLATMGKTMARCEMSETNDGHLIADAYTSEGERYAFLFKPTH